MSVIEGDFVLESAVRCAAFVRYSEFGGCPLFGSRKCTASTGIAVGTSTAVRYSEEVRYWEGPLSEVPLYKREVSRRVPSSRTHGGNVRVAKVKINVFLVILILKLRSPNVTIEQCHEQMATSSSQVPTQQLLIAFQCSRSVCQVSLSHLLCLEPSLVPRRSTHRGKERLVTLLHFLGPSTFPSSEFELAN